jgi:TonB family protein
MRQQLVAGLALALAAAVPAPAWSEAAAPLVSARPELEDAAPAAPSRAERLEAIRLRIQAALRYPPLARWRAASGEAVVRFEIAADRRARGVRIERSSGLALLDRAALRAVLEAGELPYVHGLLEVPVRFDLAEGERVD